MYIEIISKKRSGRVHKCILLRESFREGTRVKHRTLANLTGKSEEEIAAIKFALKHKGNLPVNFEVEKLESNQGLSVGAVIALREVAKKLGIVQSLGRSAQGSLALWQILARIIRRGSRLGAVRLAQTHAACDVLGMDAFNEDELYHNLDWLSERQAKIEKTLFKLKNKPRVNLFLYDVTSSYLEGECNEYGDYGYNRDRKRGKLQIVIGLLTDAEGDPVSVQVFQGNTSDNTTVVEQVHKVIDRFGVKHTIFVGDRGMLKEPQLKEIEEFSDHITALTAAQIRTLIKKGIVHLDMFKNEIHTVRCQGIRYILRRNPFRQQEIANKRDAKRRTIEELLSKQNNYLAGSTRRKIETAVKMVNVKIKKLGAQKWLTISTKGRCLTLHTNEEILKKESELDGCYVIKTNVPESSEAKSAAIHDRYKDLIFVEWAFRTEKSLLEIRPIFLRLASRTEGHVFVVMLAYKIIRYLALAWKEIGVTIEEGIAELDSICLCEIKPANSLPIQIIPKPRPLAQKLLDALAVDLPQTIQNRGITITPRKKLSRPPSKRGANPQRDE